MDHLGCMHLCAVEAAGRASDFIYRFTSGQSGNLRLGLLPALIFCMPLSEKILHSL
jgi:hypothetical protein